ncbi:amino acid/polyamine/organocation transporter, APC superfamily [Psychrobacillus psychrotolerans]|uniref:Amino acid/polyamine/organocation transporter, APC superfamily n=1 Tax=Psychrobacillus psychrotolerans TaxID=126156 RepID=A0A1I5WQJ4_9BACI|nr:amino acid permease [Psychrobacillus psychrotolerans]SFQ22009.1 amino acid/polyamine/organocation transporter, APC superfamily [Psychrobacillus psychrotolerans]
MSKKPVSTNKEDGHLAWWQLSLIGVGCIIGTGFFLASSIAIQMTGPSVILAFTMAACATYIVFEALAKMSANDPQKGSFRTYAKKAYGRWAGFSSGWVYWCSEILIIGSQLTAISLLTKLWFPKVALWIFALIYAICGLLVLFIGAKAFGKLESVFAVMKIAAIFMFIIIAVLALTGVIDGNPKDNIPSTLEGFFPKGILGFWSALLFAFYAHGGIEVMGVMAIYLKKKEDAPKSGKVMLGLLGIIYVTSLILALLLMPYTKYKDDKSPFVTALSGFNLDFFPHVFTAAIIIAGFSTMSASLFSVTTILTTLSEEGDAPAIFSKQTKKKFKTPLPAIALTSVGLILSIVTSLLLPDKVYQYITTAAALMLLYNWLFILAMYHRLVDTTKADKVKRVIGIILVSAAVSGALFHSTSRPGFFISLIFLSIIAIIVLFLRKKWKKEEV